MKISMTITNQHTRTKLVVLSLYMILCLIELFKRVKNGYLIWRELFNQTSLSGAGSLAKEAIKEKEIGRKLTNQLSTNTIPSH